MLKIQDVTDSGICVDNSASTPQSTVHKPTRGDQRSIHHLFEAQVARTPDCMAIASVDQALTYHQLDAAANQLAHYLMHRGVGPEVLVGLCVERSLEMVIAILAILKAGGAYVPLDPAFPKERLLSILADGQAPLVVTTSALAAERLDEVTQASLPASTSLVCLDTERDAIAQYPSTSPQSTVTATNLAYVIYTSGSTGTPKGVMIEHQALVNYAMSAARVYRLGAGDRVLQFCSISFDAAVEEIFCTLVSGATLVLRTDAMASNLSSFLKGCQSLGITVLSLPTAFWHHITAELARTDIVLPKALRLVIIGGERAIPARFRVWQARVGPHVQLLNTYGPTETTVIATWSNLSELDANTEGELPIGRPLEGLQTYVLDENRQPVATGEVGELYVGGRGVARGYLNRPDLTMQRFILNPLSQATDQRLYQTGDRVRYRADGQLEFVGRVDHQVKIRGFRVELSEIEALLNHHPLVQDGVVVAREEQGNHKRLVAYVVLNSATQHAPDGSSRPLTPAQVTTQITGHLQAKLPAYMIPAAFVVLEALPLTPTGKVDRQRLPQPTYTAAETYVAPRTPIEAKLSAMWSKLLHLDRVGVCDNFFALGGDSLLTAVLMTYVEEAFQVEVFTGQFYQSPTVEGLAALVEQAQQGAVFSPVSMDLQAEVEALPAIAPAPGQVFEWVDEPRHLFLTGATGFLGAFLLHDLLQHTSATVSCLIRAASEAEAMGKLRSVLRTYQLWQEDWGDRIIPVLGDLGQPNLGLTVQQFNQLAERVDAIYHSGATVDFVKPYSVLKAANVMGTQTILAFACQHRLKPVHYISTLGVFGAFGHFTGASLVAEDTDLAISEHFLHLDDGYAQSKWVAEQIVSRARANGVPINIFRPGFIVGHSQTGAHNPKDFISRLIKGCIQLGSFPALEEYKEQMVSVDYVSRAIVHLSTQQNALGQTFHLTPLPGQDLVLSDLFGVLSSYGYSLKKQPYAEWAQALIQQVKQSKENALAPLLPLLTERVYRHQQTLLELYEHTPDYDSHNAIAGLAETAIAPVCILTALQQVYLPYLIDSEFLSAPASARMVEFAR
ncbi:amino acid adenylation domain-containing protein [Leptolyngbya sp. AN02str]|uniref:non-ribosomal peptide synthetase family protein n=1 Tax=Leptolyngbya sp. AN02str TaxID=3423363 RepID=UPI003D32260A